LERNLKSKSAANALAIIRHPDAVKELARIAMTRDSIVARRAFGKVVGGGGFSAEPPQRVAEWWNRIKKDYHPLSKNHTSAEATGEGN
jgi:hypothetical protein